MCAFFFNVFRFQDKSHAISVFGRSLNNDAGDVPPMGIRKMDHMIGGELRRYPGLYGEKSKRSKKEKGFEKGVFVLSYPPEDQG